MPIGHGDGPASWRLEDRSRRRQPSSSLRRSGLRARRRVSPAPHSVQARAKLPVLLPSIPALRRPFALLPSLFVLPSRLEISPSWSKVVQLCYAESGKGDPAIRSTALGLLKSGINRSQIEAFTVPKVVAGLCAKPPKYSWRNRSLNCLRGYLATISSRNSEGNCSNPFPRTSRRTPD